MKKEMFSIRNELAFVHDIVPFESNFEMKFEHTTKKKKEMKERRKRTNLIALTFAVGKVVTHSLVLIKR